MTRSTLVAAAFAFAWACTAAQPAGVVLAGRMGERALLVIAGQPVMLAGGQSSAGVRFVRWVGTGSDAAAEVDLGGRLLLLRLGGTPAQVGPAGLRAAAREAVISAGPGGHFMAAGAINGRPVRFMVDTGATLVSLSRDEADRLGLDLSGARSALTQTAAGTVPVLLVNLNSVRVGELELVNVGAAIVPQPMPLVLLGNSFLARLQMRRDNDVMRLELR